MEDFNYIDIVKTLSKNRSEKGLQKIFSIPYMTMNKWRKFDPRDPKDGYMRFIVEYLKRVSLVETFALQEKLDDVKLMDELNISAVIRMPIVDVRKYITSLVTWKGECIQFIQSIDVRLLEAQREVLLDMLDAQSVDTLDDTNEMQVIRQYFSENIEPGPVFNLNKEQEKNTKSPPTKEQIQIVSRIAAAKGKVIPPKVRLYANRLQRWGSRTKLMQDIS